MGFQSLLAHILILALSQEWLSFKEFQEEGLHSFAAPICDLGELVSCSRLEHLDIVWYVWPAFRRVERKIIRALRHSEKSACSTQGLTGIGMCLGPGCTDLWKQLALLIHFLSISRQWSPVSSRLENMVRLNLTLGVYSFSHNPTQRNSLH